MNQDPIVVVGDGWAALATVGFLATSGVEVRWIEGSGTKMTSPLASMEAGLAPEICAELGRLLGIDLGDHQQGSFIREFRNKAFRQPPWMKAPDLEARVEVRDELLWEPERRIANTHSAKFSIPISEIEEKFRKILLGGRFGNLQRIEGVPLSGIRDAQVGEEALIVEMANGQSVRCSQIIYADRWSLLRKLGGFPKSLKFIQKRDPMGVIQAIFDHRAPVGVGVNESFYASLHKENGEEIERNLWGYFSSDGMRSFWTFCLAEDEIENNHEIGKKFRRLKSTLDRIFTGDVFIPQVPPTEEGEDKANDPKFTANIIGERVKLIEDALFTNGEPVVEPISIPQLNGVVFLTDSYGPSAALQQVGAMLGVLSKPEVLGPPLREMVENPLSL